MLHFELAMIQTAPKEVKDFVYKNLFQRNQNHNNQNTGQGIDYKLEEYNKLFKNFEVSVTPSIDDWTQIASAAQKFKQILEKQSADYNLNYGISSEPCAPAEAAGEEQRLGYDRNGNCRPEYEIEPQFRFRKTGTGSG